MPSRKAPRYGRNLRLSYLRLISSQYDVPHYMQKKLALGNQKKQLIYFASYSRQAQGSRGTILEKA